MESLEIRKYHSTDVGEILELFYDTVHSINLKDYTEEQVNAWATGEEYPKEWDVSLQGNLCYVALVEGHIVGFGDMDAGGYLDRLFVHKDFQRLGIGSVICDRLEMETDASTFTVHASITAVPFFEARGYKIIKGQVVERRGVCLKNYLMIKTINPDTLHWSTGID